MPADDLLVLDTARALFPPPRQVRLTRSSRRPSPGSDDLLVLPRARAARLLLPADRPQTQSALVRTGSGGRAGLGAGLVARAHGRGLLGRLPLLRVRVERSAAGGLLEDLLPGGDAGASYAILLGSWRHPRSVVVRVFDRVGDTVAYAKVGISAAGRHAVQGETVALTRVPDFGLRRVHAPRVLHSGVRDGVQFVTISVLAPGAGPPPGHRLPREAMAELAGAGVARTAPVTSSSWFTDLEARIDRVHHVQVRDLLLAARRSLVDSASHLSMRLGPWHGDWTAWNMAWDGDRVMLWDWEHFAEDVPVGADPLHFRAQQLRVERGPVEQKERAWWAEAEQLVGTLPGVVPGSWPLVTTAYLLEVNLRYALDRQDTPQSGELRDGWGLSLLDDVIDRLAREALL